MAMTDNEYLWRRTPDINWAVHPVQNEWLPALANEYSVRPGDWPPNVAATPPSSSSPPL
jgi:hypothetical protein